MPESNQHKRPLSASFSEALDYAQQTVNGEIPYEETWFVIADAYISLFEQYQAAHAALSKIAHWGELSEQERRQIAGEALGIEPLAGHEHPAAQEGTASQVPYPANEPEA